MVSIVKNVWVEYKVLKIKNVVKYKVNGKKYRFKFEDRLQWFNDFMSFLEGSL